MSGHTLGCWNFVLSSADRLGDHEMSTTVTHDIRITVRSRFEAAHSDPKAGRFLFSYRISITNTGRDTVQLLRRHWYISDSLAPEREVEGPGVIGETPTLEPNRTFSYSSASDLRSGFGKMKGTYRMVRKATGEEFDVTIPEFQLNVPYASN